MTKQFIGLVLCILLGLSLNSCQRTEEPQEDGVVTNTSRSLSIELSSELAPEEVGLSAQELRSMAFTSGGNKPGLHRSSDWRGHLFFRKKGDDSFVGYAAVTWKVSYDQTKKKFVLKSTSALNIEHVPALPALGETWYVAAVLGGGELGYDKQSVSFRAYGAQESKDGITKLEVPFVSNWAPLTITVEKDQLTCEAHFRLSPKGFIARATIKNSTNYDYRIYRHKSVNGRLSPELPRLGFQILSGEDRRSGCVGLTLYFSGAENPDASLQSGIVSTYPQWWRVTEFGPHHTNTLPIYPDSKNPITLKAKEGLCNVLFWGYAPPAQDVRLVVGSAQSEEDWDPFSPAFFRRDGSTAKNFSSPVEDYAVNIPAVKVRDGKPYQVTFEMYRRPTMAIDYILSPDEAKVQRPEDYLGDIMRSPLGLAQFRLPYSIATLKMNALSSIFPEPKCYVSKSTSGAPVFEESSPEILDYSFTKPFTQSLVGPDIRDQIKGMGDGKTIYALRFMPTTVNQVGDRLLRGYDEMLSLFPDFMYLYRDPEENTLSTDGERQSAYRYEYVDDPKSSGRKALKVTARYLGNAWSGSIDDIANVSFWNANSERNVVYYFPQNTGYLKHGSKGGSFLGFSRNGLGGEITPIYMYDMTHHGFSEWGIWGEHFHVDPYERPKGSKYDSQYMQELDNKLFGVPYYISSDYYYYPFHKENLP